MTAADADRVREIVVEALGLTREMLAAGSDRSLILGHIDQALAALKSTAAKEGEKS